MTDRQWHELPITKRKALLREAGYSASNYAYRVFHFIPKMIQIDVGYVYLRHQS